MPGPYKWRHHLRGYGSRWTAPRKAVLELLSRTSKHMSAKEIYASLHREHPGMGLTSVYRTLDLLVRMGILNRLSFGSGENRYEFKSGASGSHHHHLICLRCEKIIDYTDFIDKELDLIKKTEEALTRKHGFKIVDHNVEFYGICRTCLKKGGESYA